MAPDGLAARVGLRPGDFIRAINGKQVRTEQDIAAATAQSARRWQVTIERGGQQITSTFSL